MGHLYGRYPRLLVGVHSVLATRCERNRARGQASVTQAGARRRRAAYYKLGGHIKDYSEAGLLPAQFNQATHTMFTARLYALGCRR